MALLPHREPPPPPRRSPSSLLCDNSFCAGEGIVVVKSPSLSLSLVASPSFYASPWEKPQGSCLFKNTKKHTSVLVLKPTHPPTLPPPSLPLFSVRGEAGKTEGGLQLGSTVLSLQCLMVRGAEGANLKWLHDTLSQSYFFFHTPVCQDFKSRRVKEQLMKKCKGMSTLICCHGRVLLSALSPRQGAETRHGQKKSL